jgi:4-carboxymuconolactone decarboxylase
MLGLHDPAKRRATGLAAQAEITGAAPLEPTTLLQESWRDYIFAEIWTRPGLDRRSRFLIAIASAASSNGPSRALESYLRGALVSGVLTVGELREAALHLAVYGGWSRGEELDDALTRVANALDLAPVALAPIRAEPWDAQQRIADGIAEFKNVMMFPGPPPSTPFFEAGIDNFVFGEMWMRAGLDQRARRWITLVGVCASAAPTPINSHIHTAMASGNCTPDEMQEFVLQYAVHAGWPLASLIQGAVIAMTRKVSAGLPYDG